MAARLRAWSCTVGHDHRRRPQVGAEQLRHPPREHPGDVLVAGVLVAEPREVGPRAPRPGCRRRGSTTWSGLAEPERQHDRRRPHRVDDVGERGRDRRRPWPRSSGARYWWSTKSSQRCSRAEHLRARRGPPRGGARRRRRRLRTRRARPTPSAGPGTRAGGPPNTVTTVEPGWASSRCAGAHRGVVEVRARPRAHARTCRAGARPR